MAKNVKKTPAKPASGRFVKTGTTAKTAAARVLEKPPAKTRTFSDGVKAVSRRDRDGLIKLADR